MIDANELTKHCKFGLITIGHKTRLVSPFTQILFYDIINDATKVPAIPLDQIIEARKEIRNLTLVDDCMVDVEDVIKIIDKLTDKEENE